MSLYWKDNHRILYNGSCLNMPELADNSIQCVVTSPPYWGLRKYAGEQDLIWGGRPDCLHEWTVIENRRGNGDGRSFRRDKEAGIAGGSLPLNTCSLCGAWSGAYGLEPTPELYIAHSVEILREIRRVLRPDGVVFWNIGDSYWGGKGQSGGQSKEAAKARYDCGKSINREADQLTGPGITRALDGKHPVIKPKDLCLIPQRMAIAAQEDGWWVRSIIIWSKNNPMPESVTDRPTDSHEYIIMLTKSAKYYWDQEAVREAIAPSTISRGKVDFGGAKGRSYKPDISDPNYRSGSEQYGRTFDYQESCPNGRNLRSVWTFPTQPYKEAHFSTFPSKLPEICIKAATPEGGCCFVCGTPYRRIIEKVKGIDTSWNGSRFDDGKNLELHPDVGRREDAHTNGGKVDNTKRLALLRQQARENGGEYVNRTKTTGWKAQCKCEGGGSTLRCPGPLRRQRHNSFCCCQVRPPVCRLRNFRGILPADSWPE